MHAKEEGMEVGVNSGYRTVIRMAEEILLGSSQCLQYPKSTLGHGDFGVPVSQAGLKAIADSALTSALAYCMMSSAHV